MLKDPRFTDNTDRVEHRAECVGELNAVFATNTTDHWVDRIVEAGVPCGPINTVSDVVSNPQVLARNMIAEVDHPKIPNLKFPGSPLKLTDSPASIRRVPPSLGQHNEEILIEAGYPADIIADLKERGVLGS
jgi:crotonobetainyl-CoA:carnitine CoA-transferase CaiB-like acyl-CoA transferase